MCGRSWGGSRLLFAGGLSWWLAGGGAERLAVGVVDKRLTGLLLECCRVGLMPPYKEACDRVD